MSGTQGEYVVFNVVDVPISGADGFEQAFAQRQSKPQAKSTASPALNCSAARTPIEYIVVSRWRDETPSRPGAAASISPTRTAVPPKPDGRAPPTGSETQTFTVVLSEPAYRSD